MRPTIVIGDIHGLTYWKEVVKQNPDCRYIFMGDYLDPYTHVSCHDLIENLNAVIGFKKKHPDDVILLLGNHDMHYITEKMPPCSRYNDLIEKEVHEVFRKNMKYFQFAFQDGRYLFTHAGVTQPWFDDDFQGDATRNIAEQLNHPANEAQDLALYFCSRHRGGPNNNSGIFWTD
ncbi:MAG: metallophosphoesterase, partial [Prevotellaceae bacterium]|nr:metallophosphoesterase [Prevotellaceae bacterium]